MSTRTDSSSSSLACGASPATPPVLNGSRVSARSTLPSTAKEPWAAFTARSARRNVSSPRCRARRSPVTTTRSRPAASTEGDGPLERAGVERHRAEVRIGEMEDAQAGELRRQSGTPMDSRRHCTHCDSNSPQRGRPRRLRRRRETSLPGRTSSPARESSRNRSPASTNTRRLSFAPHHGRSPSRLRARRFDGSRGAGPSPRRDDGRAARAPNATRISFRARLYGRSFSTTGSIDTTWRLKLQLGLLEARRDADQLREVEDRHLEPLAGLRLELLLPRVEREVAERARRDHRVGAGLDRLLDRLDQLAERHLLTGLDDREAAALDLRRVVDRLAAAGVDDRLERRRLIGILETEQLRGAQDLAAVERRDPQPLEALVGDLLQLLVAVSLGDQPEQMLHLDSARVGRRADRLEVRRSRARAARRRSGAGSSPGAG